MHAVLNLLFVPLASFLDDCHRRVIIRPMLTFRAPEVLTIALVLKIISPPDARITSAVPVSVILIVGTDNGLLNSIHSLFIHTPTPWDLVFIRKVIVHGIF